MATPEEIAAKYGGVLASPDPDAIAAKYGGVPDKPASRGFLGELWDEVKNGPANLLKTRDAINNAVLHPYKTVQALGAPMMETARKAKAKWQSGDYAGAAADAVNTGINAVVPGLGSSSSEAGEMLSRGDYAGGAGKTLGIGANVALGIRAPQIAKTLGTAAAETITPGVQGPVGRAFQVDPRVAVNRALRPIPSDTNFPARVPGTLKAIKEANAGEAPTGITSGKLDLIEGTNKAISQHQAVLDKWLNRAKGVRVNGNELVAATQEAIPEMMWERDSVGAQRLIDQARQAFGGKTYTVQQFRNFLKSENGDLSAFYKKAPGAQMDAEAAGTPIAIQEAQADRIREVLYNALDPEGAGAGPRLIQQKTGDLLKMRRAAEQRNNAIVAEQPLTPVGKVVDPLKAGVRAMMPGKATGAGIAYAEGSEGRSLPYLRKAFKAVGDEPANVLPEPGEPLYPTGNPAKQITSGDIIPAPPADPSGGGAIHGMYPTGPNPARALPPATTRFTPPPGADDIHPSTTRGPLGPTQGPTITGRSPIAPPDTSGVRSIPGQRQVPQAEPSVIPPSQTQRVIDMQTQPYPHGAQGDVEWWAKQPLTQPELQSRYAELFNKAENLSPQKPVQVPESGTPEVVSRGVDARENIARQVLKGKTLAEATPTERNVIDQLVSEGYGSAPPQFAHGGIAGLHGPEKVIVGDGGEPEAIIPLSLIRMMGLQAQRHLLRGIGSHLGIGNRHRSTLGEEIGGRGRFQENQ